MLSSSSNHIHNEISEVLTSAGVEREVIDNPLWRYVKVLPLNITAKKGGNKSWVCNFCNKSFQGSYSRVKSHLLKLPGFGIQGCPKVDLALRDELEKEQVHALMKKEKEKSAPTEVPLPPIQDSKKRKAEEGPIDKLLKVKKVDELDKKCARMFYSGALPFNFARDPYFVDYIRSVANSRVMGYSPPSYNSLRNTLLAQERANIESLLVSFKKSWENSGVSIVSDGWTDTQRRPLINFMAVSSAGAMFIKAVDASGVYKDTTYMSDLFIQVIEEVGPQKVVQIITDNAAVCRSAGKVVEGKYPHIFWTPCVVHSLNLALKSICQPKCTSKNERRYSILKWIVEIEQSVREIRNFVVNHSMALSIFNSYSRLKLLRVAETRFASTVIMIRRLKKVKNALEKMVLDKDWKYLKKVDEEKAKHIRDWILSDEWWEKIEYILEFTEPIINMLRVADTDTPILHLVYDMWDTMIEEVKLKVFRHEKKDVLTGQSDYFDILHEILVERWNKSLTPLHCVAHSLNPKYYSHAWLEGGGNGVKRVAPNKDTEVSKNRIAGFERLVPREQLKKINGEFGKFCTSSGYFNQLDVMEEMSTSGPQEWWGVHGFNAPMLQNLAAKLLSQPASSSCCERNWSTYSQILDIKRSKLTCGRAEDLVYVHTNLRLISRKKAEYTKGPFRYWDVGVGNEFDPQAGSSCLTLDDEEEILLSFDDDIEEVTPIQTLSRT